MTNSHKRAIFHSTVRWCHTGALPNEIYARRWEPRKTTSHLRYVSASKYSADKDYLRQN